jgi:23S rRNA maturation mini-RNase III
LVDNLPIQLIIYWFILLHMNPSQQESFQQESIQQNIPQQNIPQQNTSQHNTSQNPVPEDVLGAFKNMVCIQTLKRSRKDMLLTYGDQLQCISKRISDALIEKNYQFRHVSCEEIYGIVVDHSIVSQQEFTVRCSSNKRLAYVGDAVLTLYIAKMYFNSGKSGWEYQFTRSEHSKASNLAKFHDSWFNFETVLLVPNQQQSQKQKAEFIEALIGMLEIFGHDKSKEFVCNKILGYRGG